MQLSHMIPGVNIIGRKVSVASINGAGRGERGGCRKPGVLKPQQGVKGCCPLRTFVGYKYHLDWIKIDLNVAKIITVQDYKHFKK